ncbi:hypothetical protein QTP88_007737 [Uroleucon formosanum]
MIHFMNNFRFRTCPLCNELLYQYFSDVLLQRVTSCIISPHCKSNVFKQCFLNRISSINNSFPIMDHNYAANEVEVEIDGNKNLAFICPSCRIDGTFKTVPKRPPQFTKGCLLTFHVLFHNVSFPMVYALTSKMTQATYESFFNIILRVLPLNYAQLTIVTDYERGLMNAVRSIFIESNLQGCWFHYCQAVIRCCRRTLNNVFHLFQNSPEAHRVLRMVM